MKNITAFYMNGCPYCKGAKEALAELIEENPAYRQVAVDWYEESEHPEVVQGHSYYYVPSMFIGTEKLYEAQPGQSYDDIKAHVKAALDAALKAKSPPKTAWTASRQRRTASSMVCSSMVRGGLK